jgi:hypothetical protein
MGRPRTLRPQLRRDSLGRTMLVLRILLTTLAIGLLTEVHGQAPSPTPVRRLPENYILRGTVRDSTTGAPVSGARIWPYLKGWGVVSDAQGNYELRWRGRAVWTIIVRLCDDRNVTTIAVDFFRDSVVQRDISIAASSAGPCRSSDRLPWAVDARDTTPFTGHYTYSWEGGGWLETCGGTTYSPDWDSALGQTLKQRQQREGQVSFVRFLGRVAPDRLGDNLAPGLVRMNYPGPIYLVSKVVEVRDPRPDDCR